MNKIIIGQMDKKSLALFSSNFFANLTFFSMLAILTLYFTEACRFSLQFAGFFMFLILIFSRVGRIILLPLLKKYSSKTSLTLSALLMSIGYFILYLTTIKLIMLFAFFMMGVGYGCNSVYVRSLIGTGHSPNKLSYVQLSVITNLSAAIGSLLAVYIFTHLSGQTVFLYSAIMMLLSALIVHVFLQNEQDHVPDSSMLHALRFILVTPGVFRIFGFTILSWITFVQIFSTLPLLVNNQLGATQLLGGLYATNTIMIVIFSMPLNKYLLKYNMNVFNFLTIGFLFIGCGFFLLYFMPTIATSYLAMALWTLGEILILPVLNSSLSELTSGRERLHVFAFNGIAIGLGEGIGMYLGTVLAALQPTMQISQAYLYLSLITLFFLLLTFKHNTKGSI